MVVVWRVETIFRSIITRQQAVGKQLGKEWTDSKQTIGIIHVCFFLQKYLSFFTQLLETQSCYKFYFSHK